MPERIVFLGMPGVFSVIPLRTLLEAGLAVVGVIIPRRHQAEPRWLVPDLHSLPMSPPTLTGLAVAQRIPILEAGSLRRPEALAALDSLQPDVIVCACFPRLLPREWLARPRRSCLNLHPSLLPAYRGPEPLFWQFRNGEARTGVTLHFMDEGADTGDMIAQAEVPFPDGISSETAEELTAEAGARWLVEALRLAEMPRRPQPNIGVSYAPRPAPADLVIPTTWSARRAFNFIRGASEWGPFEIVTASSRYAIRQAMRFLPEAVLGAETQPDGARRWIQFSPGAMLVLPEGVAGQASPPSPLS